ncbi:GlcG/HbpS family heme-binding protein [Sphingomonas mali]|uniref:GlcG/HbpS family heme-binding protein n=1 Tax=Sphingomonas mali TaxID=40682 RepID=UPI000829C48E|nr:heme-binding protein [Sphingomonas mali]
MDLLTAAKTLAERVETEATKAKVPVAVCIVDVHGNLVLQHRMNGAPLFSLEISERKAYTSALVGARTADLLALVQPGQALYALPTVGGGRFCPMGGGVPLVDNGSVFAGVGVSGGTAEQDVAIVEAALKAAT